MDKIRKYTLNLKFLFVFLYIFTIIIIDTLFTIHLGEYGKEKLQWVEHTNDVIVETEKYISALKDMETGQRGYLLTNNHTYLDPYYSGLKQSEMSFLKLSNLTSDNQRQLNRLELISKPMQLKFKELKETIQTKSHDEAIEIVKMDNGKKYMDEIRMIVSSFVNEEKRLLVKRKKELHEITLENLFIFRTIIFSLLLVLFYFIYITLIQKNKIQFINDSLEVKIKEEVEKNKKKDAQVFQQSRLAQMGEMLSMVAHQWRQPLASISAITGTLTFDMMMNEYKKEFFQDKLGSIDKITQHLSATINDFRDFYKPNKKKTTVKLEEIVRKSLSIIRETLLNDNIEIIEEYNSKEEIEIYDNELMQVILNIIKNAQDNLKEKQIKDPYIQITTENRTISICDNGGGIAENIIEKIFDPYFSTKNEKNGTGLGLYMSKTIVEEHHNGKLSAQNKNDGVCFIIECGTSC